MAFRRLPSLQQRSSIQKHNNNNNNNATSSSHHYGRNLKTHQQHDVNVPIPTTPEDHRVTSLPFLSDDDYRTAHYAGLLPANSPRTKYFFYWLFYPDTSTSTTNTDEDDIPLVVWMNGGPGCSSNDGLFLEHGPFRLTPNKQHGDDSNNWKVSIHKQSWHTSPAYVVYVDQPVGTGLSFTTQQNDYPTNDEEVNIDFTYWFQEFLLLYSDVFLNDDKTTMKRPLYFSGESHAGHYIPSMIQFLHQYDTMDMNKDALLELNHHSLLKIRVDGAAIGNGWVDPYYQYAATTAAYGRGLIDMSQANALDEKERSCQAQLLEKKNYHYTGCMDLLDDIIAQSEGNHGEYRVSQYDVRQWEPKHAARTFPPGHERIESYLGGWPIPSSNNDPNMDENVWKDVLQAIHATSSTDAGQRYQECTDPPYNALKHQDGLGVVDDVVALLEDGVRLLFFNGMEDLICNHVGNERLLMNLPWKHRDDWIEAKRYSWKATGESKVSGYVKEYDNLAYLKVLHSGHMVPMDVPDVALDMMRIFLYGKSFQSTEQKLDRTKDEPPAECPVCPICDDTDTTTTPSSSSSSKQSHALNTNDNDDGKNRGNGDDDGEGSNSVLRYVVAHSWIGAMIAVSVFVGAFVYVRRRQSSTTTRAPTPTSRRPAYGNLEMKEGPTSRYRDEPASSSYDDDDDEDSDDVEPNGNGII